MVNSNVGQLRKQGFEVVECHKKTENVSELKIRNRESDIITRECVFWIDIQTQRCYVKSFANVNTLIGKKYSKDNNSIELCTESGNVNLNGAQTQFKDSGLFDIKNLGAFFNKGGYIDIIC